MDIRKLQRTIVDGLEDVKAQNIAVFNTEHLSALFERVIIASGTSNRQTKALAASVRDAVRAKGFSVLRTEGDENGEWIIVDCGAAVVHVMQPTIREYYHLEEIWGEKPVRVKLDTAPRALARAEEPAATAKPSRKAAAKSAAAAPAAKKVPRKSAAKSPPAGSDSAIRTAALRGPTTRTVGVKGGAPAPRDAGRPAPARKAPTRKSAAQADASPRSRVRSVAVSDNTAGAGAGARPRAVTKSAATKAAPRTSSGDNTGSRTTTAGKTTARSRAAVEPRAPGTSAGKTAARTNAAGKTVTRSAATGKVEVRSAAPGKTSARSAAGNKTAAAKGSRKA